MQNVILVVHIFACIAMTVVVLLQRSEGGALGIGGGGGGLMSGRGAAGALVRTTMLFGGIFFATSLALTTIANRTNDTRTEIEQQLDEEEGGVDVNAPVDFRDPTATLFEETETPAETEAAPAPAETDTTPPAEPAEEAPAEE